MVDQTSYTLNFILLKKKSLSGILYKVYNYQVLGSLVSIIFMYITQMTIKKSALILCVCVGGGGGGGGGATPQDWL